MAVKYKSNIKIRVGLDENKVPEELYWSAEDGNIQNMEARAAFLSVWDAKNKDTYKINLWTKYMPVDDMKRFYHQILLSMAESFEVSTGDEKMSATMKDFCAYFAEKTGLIK